MFPLKRPLFVVFAAAFVPALVNAETLFLQGTMAGRVNVEISERYDPAPGTSYVTLRSYRTPSFRSRTWRQRVIAEDVEYTVRPSESVVTSDAVGNEVLTEKWNRPSAPIQIVRRITVETDAVLRPIVSQAPFPVGPIPRNAARFLRGSSLTPHDDPRIKDLARRLTSATRTEQGATRAILNYVVDHVRYEYSPPAHDARFALDRRIANCQGFAHLSLALLRAAGIPARLVIGVSLSKSWRVQGADGTIVFRMGQGRHAWIEVFFSDLGWIPYDPQTSQFFVSIFHIRQAVGLDTQHTVGLVTASPTLPATGETIVGDATNERFNFKTVGRTGVPRSFVVAAETLERRVVSVRLPVSQPVSGPRQEFTTPIELGNVEFPAGVKIFGNPEPAGAGAVVQARHTFIVETAEYVTGTEEFAEAFRLDQPMLLTDVSLALQKFGGRSGEIWLELFDDRGRKPGAKIGESRHLPIAGLVERGGYRWVVFDVGPGDQKPLLAPGRYWMMLHWSGDGIFNWYFSIGNAYGDPDDSRSRPRGAADWSNILNYRFNFRVAGLVAPGH